MAKPSLAALIVAKAKPAPEKPEAEHQDEDPKMGLKSAAQDLLDAVEAKDAEAVVEALCAFHDLYGDGSEAPDEE